MKKKFDYESLFELLIIIQMISIVTIILIMSYALIFKTKF